MCSVDAKHLENFSRHMKWVLSSIQHADQRSCDVETKSAVKLGTSRDLGINLHGMMGEDIWYRKIETIKN